MLLLLLACSATPEPTTSDVIAPIDDGTPDRPDSGDSGDDGDSGEADSGDSGGGTVADPVDEAPRILLNEAMSNNDCSYGVDGSMPDWFELYNASARSVTLDRIAVWDSSGAVWMGPAGTTLEPGGYYVVLADGAATGGQHAPFNLSRDDEKLTVIVDGQVTDRLGMGWLDEDMAWARFPDGGEWDLTMGGTPGESNGVEPQVFTDGTSNLFTRDRVMRLDIDFDSAAESSLTRSPQTYVQAAVSFNGVVYDPVGVRLRGSMTFQPLTGKPAFKIDMNRYADSTYCGEMKKFNSLNMYYDASLVREYMAYYIMREFGVAAVRNTYAQVYNNSDYIGIELLSETYDDVFLDQWYGYDGGVDYMIWEESGLECEEGACDNSIVNNCIGIYNNQSATEDNLAALEQCMDVDEVLREIATELTLGQWDGYCAPHNFRYAYNPVTGLIQVLPSSLDLTFDNLGYSYGGNYFQCSGSRLLSWCLSIDSCEEQYLGILDELADRIEDDSAEGMQTDAVMDEIYALIEPLVASETRGQYNYAQWEQQFGYVRTYLQALPDEIRTQVDSR